MGLSCIFLLYCLAFERENVKTFLLLLYNEICISWLFFNNFIEIWLTCHTIRWFKTCNSFCVCVFSIFTDMCSNLQTIIKHFITSKGNSVFCDSHLFNLFSLYPSLSNYLFFSLYIFYFLIILCECNYKSCDIFDYFIYCIVSRFICLLCIRTSLLL